MKYMKPTPGSTPRAPLQKAYQVIIKGACIVFLLALLYFFVFGVMIPVHKQYGGMQSGALALAVVFVGVCALLFSWRGMEYVANLLKKKWVLLIVFIGIFTIHAILAFALAIDPSTSGWDPLSIYRGALDLFKGRPLGEELGYFQAYSNNLGIVILLVGWWSVFALFGFTDTIALSVILNLLCMNMALFLTYISVRRAISAKAGLFALGLGIVFITFSLWSRTFYSDTVGLLFTAASMYLLIRISEPSSFRKRAILASLFAVVIAFGYLIKPTIVFIAIAAIAVLGVRLLFHTSWRYRVRYMLLGIGAMALSVIVITSSHFMITRQLNLTVNSMPLSNFMLLGLSKVCSPEECRYGAWNMDDALKVGEFNDFDAYTAYAKEEIQHRLAGYGPQGYAYFLSEKGAWIIGDGTFYAYREGVDKTASRVYDTLLSVKVQKNMHPKGAQYERFRNMIQMLWMSTILCVLALLFLAFRKEAFPEIISITLLSLFALLLFLLLFEARSRYVYLYLPLFIMSASYGFINLVKPVPELRRKLSKFVRKSHNV